MSLYSDSSTAERFGCYRNICRVSCHSDCGKQKMHSQPADHESVGRHGNHQDNKVQHGLKGLTEPISGLITCDKLKNFAELGSRYRNVKTKI